MAVSKAQTKLMPMQLTTNTYSVVLKVVHGRHTDTHIARSDHAVQRTKLNTTVQTTERASAAENVAKVHF